MSVHIRPDHPTDQTSLRDVPRSRALRSRLTRRHLDDAGLGTVEYVVIAIAVIGIALLLTAFLPGYLQGWIAKLPT